MKLATPMCHLTTTRQAREPARLQGSASLVVLVKSSLNTIPYCHAPNELRDL